jgi:DNA replication protein DnaC
MLPGKDLSMVKPVTNAVTRKTRSLRHSAATLRRSLHPKLLIIDDFGLKQSPKNSGEHLFEVIMRRYENRSTIMTSNRPLEECGKLLGDVPTAGAILDRFLRHAQTIGITGRSYRLKDHATIAGTEDKSKKTKSKSNEPSTAEPTS